MEPETPPLVVVKAEGTVTGFTGQFLDFVFDLVESEGLDVVDGRDDQSVGGGDGD